MTIQIAREDPARQQLLRRGRWLEYLTIGWNSAEGIVSIAAGVFAGSIALVGFGFDSIIEVTSGAVLLWRLRMDVHHERRERAEAIALKTVGISFLALALYVGFEAVNSLVRHESPAASIVGICVAAISLIVMPLLARAKRRVAAGINSRALKSDSRQTDICAYLSAILLGGLLLNAVFGWWWADPVAALVMVPIIIKEGIGALRGETCCDDGACAK